MLTQKLLFLGQGQPRDYTDLDRENQQFEVNVGHSSARSGKQLAIRPKFSGCVPSVAATAFHVPLKEIKLSGCIYLFVLSEYPIVADAPGVYCQCYHHLMSKPNGHSHQT